VKYGGRERVPTLEIRRKDFHWNPSDEKFEEGHECVKHGDVKMYAHLLLRFLRGLPGAEFGKLIRVRVSGIRSLLFGHRLRLLWSVDVADTLVSIAEEILCVLVFQHTGGTVRLDNDSLSLTDRDSVTVGIANDSLTFLEQNVVLLSVHLRRNVLESRRGSVTLDDVAVMVTAKLTTDNVTVTVALVFPDFFFAVNVGNRPGVNLDRSTRFVLAGLECH
jgi:hypothetical protein